jgi:hypothetical protein
MTVARVYYLLAARRVTMVIVIYSHTHTCSTISDWVSLYLRKQNGRE